MRQYRFYRKRTRREKNKVVLIVCEGKTEEKYFSHFNSRNLRIHVKSTKERDPVNLVKQLEYYTKEKGASIKSGDSVWLVFDMEDKKDNWKRAEEAIKMAEKDGYEIGLSIPCFELWLLLHYRFWETKTNTIDIKKELNNHIEKYKKGMDAYPLIEKETRTAIENAKKLHKKHFENGLSKEELYTSKANPITHVFKLVELLESERK